MRLALILGIGLGLSTFAAWRNSKHREGQLLMRTRRRLAPPSIPSAAEIHVPVT